MSVLVIATSVIVRRTDIDSRYRGGLEAYARDCPNVTFRADPFLVAVSFMTPSDVTHFIDRTVARTGLVFEDQGRFVDIAVVEQMSGPTLDCPWLEYSDHLNGYSMCWLRGTQPGELHAYSGWTVKDSQSFRRADETAATLVESMRSLDDGRGLDALVDDETGRSLFQAHVFTDEAERAAPWTVDASESAGQDRAEPPTWIPGPLADDWRRYFSMTESERRSFADDLTMLDRDAGTKQRQLRERAFAVFAAAAAGQLAQSMSESEGREVPVGEAGVLIVGAIGAMAQASGFRVASDKRLETVDDWRGWILSFRPHDIYSFVSGAKDQFIELSSAGRKTSRRSLFRSRRKTEG